MFFDESVSDDRRMSAAFRHMLEEVNRTSILRKLDFPMNKPSGRHYRRNLRHAQILHVRNFWCLSMHMDTRGHYFPEFFLIFVLWLHQWQIEIIYTIVWTDPNWIIFPNYLPFSEDVSVFQRQYFLCFASNYFESVVNL